jgi:hypothetical protein
MSEIAQPIEIYVTHWSESLKWAILFERIGTPHLGRAADCHVAAARKKDEVGR